MDIVKLGVIHNLYHSRKMTKIRKETTFEKFVKEYYEKVYSITGTFLGYTAI